MRLAALIPVLLLSCAPTLHVGAARPGYVLAVSQSDGSVHARLNDDGVIDSMYGFRAGPLRSLFVASYRSGTVLHYRKGRYRGVAAAGLSGPVDVLPLPGGELLVACSGSGQYLHDGTFEGRGALMRVRADGVAEPFVESDELAVPTALVEGEDGAIYVGQRNSGKVLRLVHGEPVGVFAETDLKGGPMHLAFDRAGALFAASPFDARVVEAATGRVVIEDEQAGRIGGIAFARDGALLVASHDRGEIRAYDAENGELLRVLAHDLTTPWGLH